MNDAENISPLGQRLLNRRGFMRNTGFALGGLGLAQLLSAEDDPAAFSGKTPVRPDIDPNNPYAPRPGHFAMPAKQVLVISCPGAVSHVDTFDYKPALTKLHGQKPPGIPAVTFEGPSGNIAKPFWDFKPRGQSGKMISDLLPNLGGLADDFCFIHSLHTQTSAHPQGENFINTGFTMEGFPSFGAWVTYALGSECSDLPAFVAINDPRGLARSGKNNFGSGFLPAAFQGTDFNAKNPPANLRRPQGLSAADDKTTTDLLKRFNAKHLERYPGDADLAARIASYELAGQMQTSVPEMMDLAKEPESIHKEYGTDTGTELKREYAKNCILARRLIEKGVRVVQLFNGSDPSGGNGITNWDSHSNIKDTHAMQAEIMDQPTAALIRRYEATRPARAHAGRVGNRVRSYAVPAGQRHRPRSQPGRLHLLLRRCRREEGLQLWHQRRVRLQGQGEFRSRSTISTPPYSTSWGSTTSVSATIIMALSGG